MNSRDTDPVEAVRKITGGGADFTLESSGRPAVLRQAIDALAIFPESKYRDALTSLVEFCINRNH